MLKKGSALDPQGFDAGKKVAGRKRSVLVDTLGLLLNVVVYPGDIQDRDGARLLSIEVRAASSPSSSTFADAGYQGPRVARAAASTGHWVVEIVKRNELHKFRRPVQALDRRTNPGLDQPQSPLGA